MMVFFLIFFFASVQLASGAESWKVEWEKTITAAKEERQVTVYSGSGSALLPIEAGVFQKRFPEIKVFLVTGRGSLSRILAERRARSYIPDVVLAGAGSLYTLYSAKALDSLRDALILPENTDESKWWRGHHRYIDPERRHAFVFMGAPSGIVSHNTDLVNPKDIQSFWDLLNPKWKGKIMARDIRRPGPGSSSIKLFYYAPTLGPKFIRRLFGEMDITLFRDRRQAIDWLATGKYAICFFCGGGPLGAAKRQGLPVDEFGLMKEGTSLSSAGGNMGLLDRAPHPNAAKVFINWYLSREGQLTLQRENVKVMTGNANSLRIDIPKDMIPPDERLVDGVEYTETDLPERMDTRPILKIVAEALAQAERRKKTKAK